MSNVSYQLGARDDHAVVQLTNGKFDSGGDTASPDYALVSLSEFVTSGDLTADGVAEAAGMFFENFGGSGDFGLLAVYSDVNGQPVFLASTLIDDRPMINSISIQDGEILLDAVIHGFNDPACCPALHTTRRFALLANQLYMTHYTTGPAGAAHEITISAPANGSAAAGSAHVSGSITIAPFENNLTFVIRDASGTQVATGPVPVTAASPGAPGSFDATINLPAAVRGAALYLEIQDVSAADGSLIAMDSVLMIKPLGTASKPLGTSGP